MTDNSNKHPASGAEAAPGIGVSNRIHLRTDLLTFAEPATFDSRWRNTSSFQGCCQHDRQAIRLSRINYGMFQVKVKLANPAQPEKFFEELFWVDTGALYSFVPEDRLHSIGLKP